MSTHRCALLVLVVQI